MVIRQLKPVDFERIYNQLIQKAHSQPLDPSYTISMEISGVPYEVKVQPEINNKLAVLQALRLERTEYGPDFTLITENNILLSLLEILIYQGVR